MKVRALTSSFANAPADVIQSGWSTESDPGIATGKMYDVYALAFFGEPQYDRPRIMGFQVIDDANFPTWLPSFLFEVMDGSLSPDWECNLFPSGTFVIGPRFVVESEEAYRAMVQTEPSSMQKFRARQREVESQAG